MRADAQRNLSAILTAARAAFATGGLDVGVAEIAQRAGVGTATVFRRFATKDDLICAVCEEALEELEAQVVVAEEDPDPWSGLRGCIAAGVRRQISDRGLCEALNRGVDTDPRLRASQEELIARLAVLLRRAQAAGDVREDLEPVDLGVLVGAVARTGIELEPVAPGAWRRYLDLMLDGLRPGAPALSVPAPAHGALAPR